MPSLRSLLYVCIASITVASAAGTSANLNTPSARTTSTTTLPSFVMAASPTPPDFAFTIPLTLLSPPSSTGSSAPAQTFPVQVGNGDHKFKPDVIQADVGDVRLDAEETPRYLQRTSHVPQAESEGIMLTHTQIIEFDFYPVNHSVVRAEYEHPCIPYEMTGRDKVGFWSGFLAPDAVLDDPPKYSVRVNDTAPIFFYCSTPASCTKQSMVGVINPNASTSLAHQRDLALPASYQLSPGEPSPSEAEIPSLSTLPNGTAVQAPAPVYAGGGKLGAGAVVLGVLLAFFWGRLKSLKDEVKRKDSTVVRSTEPRNTWVLAGSPAWLAPSPTPQTHVPSPPYSAPHERDHVGLDLGLKIGMGMGMGMDADSPMTSHAVPPAYYESPRQWTTSSPARPSIMTTAPAPAPAPAPAQHT
ncbi:hypothetical protein PMIN06_000729 [Paraphaeosphaeria minitans]